MTTSHQKEQMERLEVLLGDRKALVRKPDTSTMQSRALAENDQIQGRWAEQNKSAVIGSTPTIQYPAGPNWSNGPVPGVEPPLGFSVEDHEAVGEKFEIERSVGSDESMAASPMPPRAQGETDQMGITASVSPTPSTPDISGSPTAPASERASVGSDASRGAAGGSVVSADVEPPQPIKSELEETVDRRIQQRRSDAASLVTAVSSATPDARRMPR